MKFDNKPTEIKIQMKKRLLAVIIATVVALIFTTKFWDHVHDFIGLSRGGFTIILVGIYLSYYIYHILSASSFISYSDDESKIIIRFYQLNFFNSSKNSYEIPKTEFVGYKIERISLFKLRENVVVFRKSHGNIVRYPPFSISALSIEEKNKLLMSLNSFSKQQ
jgi:hypothetical protein